MSETSETSREKGPAQKPQAVCSVSLAALAVTQTIWQADAVLMPAVYLQIEERFGVGAFGLGLSASDMCCVFCLPIQCGGGAGTSAHVAAPPRQALV